MDRYKNILIGYGIGLGSFLKPKLGLGRYRVCSYPPRHALDIITNLPLQYCEIPRNSSLYMIASS